MAWPTGLWVPGVIPLPLTCSSLYQFFRGLVMVFDLEEGKNFLRPREDHFWRQKIVFLVMEFRLSPKWVRNYTVWGLVGWRS